MPQKAKPKKILFRPILGCSSHPFAYESLEAAQRVVLEANYLWLIGTDDLMGGGTITLNSDDNWIEVIEVVENA